MLLQTRYCIGRLGTCGADLRDVPVRTSTDRLCAECRRQQDTDDWLKDLLRDKPLPSPEAE